MRFFSIIIIFSQLTFSAELGIVLSKTEIQNLTELFPEGALHEKFSKMLSDFHLDLSYYQNKKNSEIQLKGSEEHLKIAEYLYFFWLKDLSKTEFHFSHFEGSPEKRKVKRKFSKALTLDSENAFQFSNKIINEVGNDIDGFSFNIYPSTNIFHNCTEMNIRLSYKNEEQKVGDKGTHLFDLNTSAFMKKGEEHLIKVSDKEGDVWKRDSYLSFKVISSIKGRYFKGHIPREFEYGKGQVRVITVSKGFAEIFGKNPQAYFEKLGVNFTKWGFLKFNKRLNELIFYNSKENFELLEEVIGIRTQSEKLNITTNISIYESNLIIKDTDRLEGHRLKKLDSFSTIFVDGGRFLISQSFNGDYEAAVLLKMKKPYRQNTYSFELTLKPPGPKSKAKNYKLTGNLGDSRKYRLHLDDYHFMEVEVLK